MEEKEKRGFWAFIPSVALTDKRLSSTEKLILAEIYSLSNHLGLCWPSNKHFAEMFDITETQVSLCIKNLQKYGYIETEILPNKGNLRIIRICLGGLEENLKTSLRKLKDPSLRKLKDRNTYIENQLEYINIEKEKKQSSFKKTGDITIFHCPVCGRDYPESMAIQISPRDWICKDCHLQKRKKIVEFNKKKTNKKVPLNVDYERVMAYKEKTGGKIISDKERTAMEVEIAKIERRLKSGKISELDLKY